jgi:hypothetical protein
MLRVNVGLSRKLSRDYNSTGFSVNLDAEITAPISDPEGVMEQVKELFDLTEEALNLQVERSQSIDAIAGHDAQPQDQRRLTANGNGNGRQRPSQEQRQEAPQSQGGNGREQEPATNKQLQYLQGIAKRQKLSSAQLEKKIAEILGRPVGVYDLSKQAAGVVIDALTNGASANGRRGQ